VDDGVVTGSNDEILRKLELGLKDCLEIKWQLGVDTIVGVEVSCIDQGFDLRQKKLIDKVLTDHWDQVSLACSPLPTGYTADSATEDGNKSNSTEYLSLVGILSYLAVGTQPNIAFAVNYMARFSATPLPNHWKALCHIVNYIARTKDKCLHIHSTDSTQPLQCFSNASWGGELQRLSYGIYISFFGSPILWIARQLHTVAASTCQAEYMALGMATRQLLWVQQLIQDVMGHRFKGNLVCDNESAIKVSKDDSLNKRARHTEREFFHY
jgi:hypothetical protein